MLVLCNGMIRAGSSVQYNIARMLVQELGVGWARAEFERRYPEKAPNAAALAADERQYVFKIHDLTTFEYADLDLLGKLIGTGGVRVLYIHRDVRDVAVSLMEKLGVTFDYSCKMIDGALNGYHGVQPHLGAPWLLVQRYDELTSDIEAGVEQIAALLALDPSPELIQSIVRECSLEGVETVIRDLRRGLVTNKVHSAAAKLPGSPREKLRTMAYHMSGDQLEEIGFADRETQIHFNHIGKFRGRSNVWRTELTQGQIGILNDRFGNWLREAGYAVP